MSSPVMTNMEAGASASRSACFDTEVTGMLASSSRLRSARSATRIGWADTPAGTEIRSTPTVINGAQRASNVLRVIEFLERTIPHRIVLCDRSTLSRIPDGVQRGNPTTHVGAIPNLGLGSTDQPMPHREFHQLDRVLDLELLHDPRPVGLDRLGRQRQGLGDRRVGASFDHELEDVALAQREAVERADVGE